MTEGLRATGKAWALDGAALLIGLFVAIALVSLYEFIDYTLRFPGTYREEDAFLTRDFMVITAAIHAAISGLVIILVCVPIWLLLRRYSLATAGLAALLGATGALLDRYVAAGGMGWWWVKEAIVYAAIGAVAGLAVWWSRRKL